MGVIGSTNGVLTPFPNDGLGFAFYSIKTKANDNTAPSNGGSRQPSPDKQASSPTSLISVDSHKIPFSLGCNTNKKLMFVQLKMRVVNRGIPNSSNSMSRQQQQKKKSGKIEPKVPRGLRGLSISSISPTPSARSEFDKLKNEANQIEQWWSTPRWQHTKRVYSGKCGTIYTVELYFVVNYIFRMPNSKYLFLAFASMKYQRWMWLRYDHLMRLVMDRPWRQIVVFPTDNLKSCFHY